MAHNHHHHSVESRNSNMLMAVLLNLFITAVEFAGGMFSNSLALITDAMHNLSDSITILASYFAIKIGKRKSTFSGTFGYKRVEILTAFINSSVLMIICVYIFVVGCRRLLHPEIVSSSLMLIISGIALLANLSAVFLIKKDSSHNLNIRTAYLHLLGDVFSSLALIVGSILIYFFHIHWIDPLLTILISAFIFKELIPVLIQSINILLQISPKEMDMEKIKNDLLNIQEIKDIHHIHIWNLSENDIYFEGHLKFNQDVQLSQADTIRKQAERILIEQYHIAHVTLQVEFDICNEIKH